MADNKSLDHSSAAASLNKLRTRTAERGQLNRYPPSGKAWNGIAMSRISMRSFFMICTVLCITASFGLEYLLRPPAPKQVAFIGGPVTYGSDTTVQPLTRETAQIVINRSIPIYAPEIETPVHVLEIEELATTIDAPREHTYRDLYGETHRTKYKCLVKTNNENTGNIEVIVEQTHFHVIEGAEEKIELIEHFKNFEPRTPNY